MSRSVGSVHCVCVGDTELFRQELVDVLRDHSAIVLDISDVLSQKTRVGFSNLFAWLLEQLNKGRETECIQVGKHQCPDPGASNGI